MSELKVSPPVKVPPEPKLETAPRGYWKGSEALAHDRAMNSRKEKYVAIEEEE